MPEQELDLLQVSTIVALQLNPGIATVYFQSLSGI
jgi:hypothetical protein